MSDAPESGAPAVYTIGHSARSAEELAGMLHAHNVTCLIDVRRYPSSKRFPQFNSGNLAEYLQRWKIRYEHCEALGGRRPALPDSPNTAWSADGFRGYADYLGSPDFQRALQDVAGKAAYESCAIMCAEAKPSQCHRQLIADALATLGITVHHILDWNTVELHALSAPAVVVTPGLLRYPAPQQELDLFD